MSGATISGNKATDTDVGGGIFNGGKLTIKAAASLAIRGQDMGRRDFNAKVPPTPQTGGSVTGNAPDDVFNEPN